jgi:acyl-CoA oxidase
MGVHWRALWGGSRRGWGLTNADSDSCPSPPALRLVPRPSPRLAVWLAQRRAGLIVNTTADWDAAQQGFVLHTPDDGAVKNWISQGLSAEMCVVVADLRLGGKSHGPHPFLIRIRDGQTGALAPGVEATDMGGKTVANDLDNAQLRFTHMFMPLDCLLNKFARIEGDQVGW